MNITKVTDQRIKGKSSTISTRCKQLENVLGELEALDKLVDESEKQLTKIMDELAKDEQMRNKMNEDKENTKLTLETTSEQKISLKRQIPDFQRQVDVRQHDLKASTEKRHAMYEKAVEMLQEKTPKEIEKFCTRYIICECETIPGIVSHKSLITIFGQKHKIKNYNIKIADFHP